MMIQSANTCQLWFISVRARVTNEVDLTSHKSVWTGLPGSVTCTFVSCIYTCVYQILSFHIIYVILILSYV